MMLNSRYILFCIDPNELTNDNLFTYVVEKIEIQQVVKVEVGVTTVQMMKCIFKLNMKTWNSF